ncbi:DNL-type domain-containing protein [Citrus sinensis]|uniref:uncharacterized protein LOC18043242 n=1 Tax=Citrus clementina TaxID=85681 RepID=UPI000CED22FA|nr:uncharacterized protein LOC18043242 [Citrus x clementina]XP_052295686.1 uncharacterized protein LOC102614178 isoform X2 [Citrus sinensis]KAH9707635.1 DNL-type domain-containing protein [Citrus sinensis]
MAAITACNSSPSVSSLSTHKPLDVILRPNSFKPISFSNSATPNLIRPRLRVSGAKAVVPERAYRILAVSESNSEAELSDSNKDATIDIKLPRRSLLVQFTCDGCGERTQRLINRLAYERGLVYVQCLAQIGLSLQYSNAVPYNVISLG